MEHGEKNSRSTEKFGKKYFHLIRHHCLKYLGAEDAEEAANEALYKILTCLDRFDANKAGLLTWIHRIACHHALDVKRRLRKMPKMISLSHPELRDHAAPEKEEPEQTGLTNKFLPSLEYAHRSLMELRSRGYPFKEIARMTGKSLGAVKMLQTRALKKLKASAESYQQTGELV